MHSLLLISMVVSISGCVVIPNSQTPPLPDQATAAVVQPSATQSPSPSTPITTSPANFGSSQAITPSAEARSASTPEVSTTSAFDIRAEELHGVMVRFWHPWSGTAQQAVSKLVETFNLNNPWGILVTAVPFSGYDALNGALMDMDSRIEPPDVLVGLMHQGLGWEQTHHLLDLKPYISDPEWGFSQLDIEDFYPISWEYEEIEGRRPGIPAYHAAQVLIYNQTWAEELGFSAPPSTPEEFRQQTCAAAKSYLDDNLPDNDGKGGWIIATDPAVTLGWISAFSGQPLRTTKPADGQSIYQFNTPEAQHALTYLRGLYDQGCAWLPQEPVPDLAFASRQALIAAASPSDLPYIIEAFQSQGNADRWTVLPFPSEAGLPAIYVYGPSYFALQSMPDIQLAAWLFIRWMSSPENSVRIIETNGALPPRKSVLAEMQPYANRYPQWGSALELLAFARNEPAASSWGLVRRSLEDAATQLFRSYFTVDQVETLLEYLDNFAAELHLGTDLQDVFVAPTSASEDQPIQTPAH